MAKGGSLVDVPVLAVSDEVAEGLAGGRAVVALESTLLAHGLPKDRRTQVALSLEAIVRAEGAVPATIAIFDGRLRVGLDDAGLARLVDGRAAKASLWDIAPALALGGAWATTVASTAAIAYRAGVRWFATGGIGGVHRDAPSSYDESADLAALARFPVGVVSAGPKAVLDLPRTLERLETLGVPVVGFRTSSLPSFYHGQSGLSLPCSVDREEDVARIAIARFDGLSEGGLLVVRPPPDDVALEPARVERLMGEALEEAARAGIRGRDLTPFLLSALDHSSGGDVVRTNIALIEANARLAARIAVADAALRSGGLD